MFSFLVIVTYFGGGLCLLMALAQLTGKYRTRTNYLCAALLSSNGIVAIFCGLMAAGAPHQVVHSLIIPFMTAIYLIGPINYMYFYSLVYPEFQINTKTKLMLLPLLPGLLSGIIMQFQPDTFQAMLLEGPLLDYFWHWFTFALGTANLMVICFFVYLLINVLSVRGNDSLKEGSRVIILANGLAIFVPLLIAYGFLFSNLYVLNGTGVLLMLIHSFIFLSHSRNPEFFHLLKLEIRNKIYTRSIIKSLDVDVINEHLLLLMKDEKLYLEFDMDLKQVARRLSITPHQLSQFVNEKHKMSFPNFVNSFRVTESKRLLLENPEQSAISICFHAGFSSKSSFNIAFRKFTGQSPGEFRKAAARKS